MQEIAFDVDGLKLTGWLRPRTGAASVFCLHGWLDNAASFLPLSNQLPNFDWTALDLSGHGLSAHKSVGTGDYHVIDWALEVAQVLAMQGGPARVLVGHSLGAGIAGLVAALVPERVRGVVFLDGFAPLSAEAEDFIDRGRTFLAERAGVPRANRTFATFDAIVAKRAVNGGLSEASSRILMERACPTSGAQGGIAIASDPNLKRTSPLRLTFAHLRAALERIECPVLLIDFGNAHFQRPAELHAELVAAVGNLTVVKETGGHHLHMDDPARVAPHIERFVAGI